MAERNSSITHASRMSSPRAPGPWSTNIEMVDRAASVSGPDRFHAEARRRRVNDDRMLVNPLAHYSDDELVVDVADFQRTFLPAVDVDKLLRAARVGKDIKTYDDVARSQSPEAGYSLPVKLTDGEKWALKRERDVPISEKGMYIVVLTVSLAAFLQGQVQSSINGAALYPISPDQWAFGAANASPFLFAAVLGCPLALPINRMVGRRGAMLVAAFLIFVSSLASAFCRSWSTLFGVRIINGLGMGIKAVSTPILASETAVGFWRGTSILAWQLWVAFGIMMGFVFNLIFQTSRDDHTTVSLILGAPFVPALAASIAIWFCPESPRFYMSRGNFNPAKALEILLKLRNTELQAFRDLYLIYKSIQQENYIQDDRNVGTTSLDPNGFLYTLLQYFSQYKQLFLQRRLRNALISSSTVSLAQQLCGINVMAFYSGTLFANGGTSTLQAMLYSFGFGAVNFICGLPAIRTIDTLGRRKWLTATLPVMAVLMLAASLSFLIKDPEKRDGIAALFLFLFAAAYSPGLGPIPFTLASESFPLSHREAGCAFSIGVNLGFAGLLSIVFPSIIFYLDNSGTLGLFAGLNVLAFVLVFLLVEETKRRTLEDLDLVFAVRKREFMKFQVETYLPWFFRHYLLRKDREEKEKPSLYIDFTWDAQVDGSMMRNVDTSETTHPHEGIPRESGLDDEQIGPTDIEHEPERQDSDSEDSLHR